MIAKLRWIIAQSAERKWWQNYLRNKNVGEYLAWKKNYWLQLLEKCKPHLRVNDTQNILDAGCGPAGIFMCFDKNNVTAFDPLLDSYEKDIEHFSTINYNNVTFITSSIENFATTQTYDVVFCMNAINHVLDINVGYDQLMKFVKPNGILVVSIDAHNINFFKYLFKLLPGDILHPHQYDLKEYHQFLLDRNFEILNTIQLKKEFFFNHYIQIARRNF